MVPKMIRQVRLFLVIGGQEFHNYSRDTLHTAKGITLIESTKIRWLPR
jgi:hypothetical protein